MGGGAKKNEGAHAVSSLNHKMGHHVLSNSTMLHPKHLNHEQKGEQKVVGVL